MKKIFLLALIFVLGLSAMSFAAMNIGAYGSFGTNAWDTQPILVITPGNLKTVNYDILLGYSSVGAGDGNDAAVGMLLGGTWWVDRSGPITYGPTLLYYSQGNWSALSGGGKASDNTLTSLDLLFSCKTALLPQVDLRADILLLSSVGGKSGGSDVKDSNTMFDTIQLGIVFNFPM